MVYLYKQLLPGNFQTTEAADVWLRDNPRADADRFDYVVVTCWHGVPTAPGEDRKPDANTSYRIRRMRRR